MGPYITDLKVSLNQEEEKELTDQGYTKVPGDLNEGTKGNKIYLWYNKDNENPVTRIQFSFNKEMSSGLKDAGYTMIEKNLNAGADGDTIYLWFCRGSLPSDVPFTDVAVALDPDAEAKHYQAGWERLACDLNRNAGGNMIYLFVQRARPVYICEITASDTFETDSGNFQKGYIRVDENTNREAGGKSIFLWYLLTPDVQKAINGPLHISINDEQYHEFENQGYTPVKQDLNEGTGGNPVYLWYNKEGPEKPIRHVSVILNTAAVASFKTATINVIEKNLNQGNKGLTEYLCFAESN